MKPNKLLNNQGLSSSQLIRLIETKYLEINAILMIARKLDGWKQVS